MKRKKHRLKGATLAEILVLMIVAGIVFLAVIDGKEVFVRFVAKTRTRITENMAFYEHYERLNHMISAADSIKSGEKGRLEIYREGVLLASLEYKDSLLIVRIKSREDTLFNRVTGIDTVADRYAEHLIDSLRVELLSPRDSALRLTFGRVRVPLNKLNALIAEEEHYS